MNPRSLKIDVPYGMMAASMHPALLLLKKIPRGYVTTYQELARACGTSPRAVGRLMARNKDPYAFPCYKVVASSGTLTGYSAPGGLAQKRALLLRDGVETVGGKVDKKYFYAFGKNMKNYSSKRAAHGKTAYRTPSRFIAQKSAQKRGPVLRQWGLASRLEHRRIGSKKK